MTADKGYDSDAIRDDLEERGAKPVIPAESNRKVQRPDEPKTYAMRNRIERFFNKIKNSRRVATRYDKLTSSFIRLRSACHHPNLDQVCPRDL